MANKKKGVAKNSKPKKNGTKKEKVVKKDYGSTTYGIVDVPLDKYGVEDWKALLDFTETRKDKDGKKIEVTTIHSLRRLASVKGLTPPEFEILGELPNIVAGPRSALVKCQMHLDGISSLIGDDGEVMTSAPTRKTFTSFGESNAFITDTKFLNYPVTIASTRAEARCIKQALIIELLTKEELNETTSTNELKEDLNKPIENTQERAIIKLATTKGISDIDKYLNDKFNLNTTVKDLTTVEAEELIKVLNKEE